jgi:hypothetical protein
MDKTCQPIQDKAQNVPALVSVAIAHQSDAKKQRFLYK